MTLRGMERTRGTDKTTRFCHRDLAHRNISGDRVFSWASADNDMQLPCVCQCTRHGARRAECVCVCLGRLLGVMR